MRFFRLSSTPARLTSLVALFSFTAAASGCMTPAPDPGPDATGVDIQVRVPGPGGEWQDVMQEHVPGDELPSLGYEYVLADGTLTTDPSVALAAPSFRVETVGGHVEFRRDGDVVELVALPPGDTPSGAPVVRAVRFTGNQAVFHLGDAGWRERAADVEITVTAGDDEVAARELRSLAMTLLLAPHQDTPQIAWLAVVAIVGVGWLAFCGGFLAGCSDACACYSGYRANCLGFTVSYINGDWDVSFEGLGCTCILPKIPGCEES